MYFPQFRRCARVFSCLLIYMHFLLFSLTGCRPDSADHLVTIRLVDLFSEASVEGQPATAPEMEPTQWTFASAPADGDLKALGVEQLSGLEGVEVSDGLLVGRTVRDFAAFHIRRTVDLDDPDLIYAIEVRLRASAGQNMGISFSTHPQFNLDRFIDVVREQPIQTLTSPLIPGDQIQTYTLIPRTNLRSHSVHHLVIWPSDVPGADFAVESVRLVHRREHLAQIPSGVSWQGLKGAYREVLVARSPETLRFPLRVPENSFLDLAVGTVEETSPVTFRITVEEDSGGEGAKGGTSILSRTVTTAYRWDDASVDLTEFAGKSITLALELSAGEEEGRVGFWGAPVIRQRQTAVADTGEKGDRPRGVILIVSDTTRRDHLDVYGYSRETAPQLHRMADEGVRFADCQSQATWTKPSVYSMMTSLFPSTHGAVEVMDRLPQSAETLAEVYRDAGYATFGMTSIYYLSSAFNFHQGFEELHEIDSLTREPTSKSAREYVDRLIPWLEDHRDVPFFVLLHVFDAHEPYKPYPPYDTMWADPAQEQAQYQRFFQIMEHVEDPVMRMLGWPNRQEIEAAGVDPEAYIQYFVDWYDGSIRAMDVEVGRLLDHLRASGLGEQTLVAFASDHGEEFLEHGRVSHGHAVYGEETNVPLILWQPGRLPAGTIVDDTVRNLDIMPTLLERSGLALPESAQGHSLMPFVTAAASGTEEAGRAVPSITERRALEEPLAPSPQDLESMAIISDDWKLIRHIQPPGSAPRYELFDHLRDPLDLHPLQAEGADGVGEAVADPGLLERLRLRLEHWQASALAATLAPDSKAAAQMDSEQLKKLRSLGYIP